jgi:hypothetical protein
VTTNLIPCTCQRLFFLILCFHNGKIEVGRSQWPRGLMRWPSAERLLGSWIRIPPGAWNVRLLWVLCVVRYRSLLRTDHSSRGVLLSVVCLNECDHVTSKMRPKLTRGLLSPKQTNKHTNSGLHFPGISCRVTTRVVPDVSTQRNGLIANDWTSVGQVSKYIKMYQNLEIHTDYIKEKFTPEDTSSSVLPWMDSFLVA